LSGAKSGLPLGRRLEALARSTSTDYHRAHGVAPDDPHDGGRVSDLGRGTARTP
jgi:hypothetical protein